MSPTVEEMRCEAVLDLIEPFIDDEVDGEVAQRLRNHLADCPSCAGEAEAARRILTELRSLPEFGLPPAVIKRVNFHISGELDNAGALSRVNRRINWLAAAAAVLVAVGAVTFSNRQPEPTDSEARRAAAEVTLALATIGNITQRANLAIKNEVIHHRVVPAAIRGFARPLQRYSPAGVTGAPPTVSPNVRIRGSS